MFPKDYKDFLEKLELNPLKMRTIVAPDVVSLIADISLFRSTDDTLKYLWRESDTFIGSPFTGHAINSMLEKLGPASQCLILDLTAYDSTLPDITAKFIAALYAPGFSSYRIEDQKVIERQIEARLDRYYGGGAMRSLEHCIDVPHLRGLTTGSVSVTRINVEASRLCLMYTIASLLNCSIREALEETQRCLMGDDILIQFKSKVVDPQQLIDKLAELTGLKAKLEFQDVDKTGSRLASFNGAKYLSHYIYETSPEHEQELKEAGILRGSPLFPNYVICYDMQKAAMMQTVELRNKNPFKLWDTAISLAEKSIHYPKMYREAQTQASSIGAKLRVRHNGFKNT